MWLKASSPAILKATIWPLLKNHMLPKEHASAENVPPDTLYTPSGVRAPFLIGPHWLYIYPPPLVADMYPKVQPPHFSPFQEEANLTLYAPLLARSVPLTWQHLQKFRNIWSLAKSRFLCSGRPLGQSVYPGLWPEIWTGQWAVGSGCGAFWRCFAALVSHKR